MSNEIPTPEEFRRMEYEFNEMRYTLEKAEQKLIELMMAFDYEKQL